MNSINLFSSLRAICFLIFVSLTSLVSQSYGQCAQQQVVLTSGPVCNENGTPNDPSDDTYTQSVYIDHTTNPTGSWTSNSIPVSGTYGNVVTFGPFPISGGNVSLTITNVANPSCFNTITLIAPAPCSVVCPAFDVCYTLLNTTSCCATYEVSVVGLPPTSTENINTLNFNFTASGGAIKSLTFGQVSGGYYTQKGVVITGNSVLGGSGMSGSGIMQNNFIIEVCAEPGSCVQLDNGLLGLIVINKSCTATDAVCPEAMQYCATGTTIGGNVNVNTPMAFCQNTSNNGVQGVDISVASSSGQNCISTTNTSGGYSCVVCGDGPFTICVDTKCPEPCGVDNQDIVLLRQYINGLKFWTKDLMFIGDANNSGTFSTLDLILITRKLLGYNDLQTTKNWCRFVPIADYNTAPDPNIQPPLPPSSYMSIDNCITVPNATTPVSFLRFMVGDINGTCSDCIHGDGMGGVGIVLNDDNAFKSIIKSPVTDKLGAFTFKAILSNPSTFLGITSPLPGIDYSLQGNILNVIWLDTTINNIGFQANLGQNLLELNFNTKTPFSLAPHQNYIDGQSSGLKEMSIASQIRSTSPIFTRSIQLGANVNIEVNKLATDLRINTYDISGKLYQSQLNNIENLDKIDLNPDLPLGLYFVQVYDGFTYQTTKIILP